MTEEPKEPTQAERLERRIIQTIREFVAEEGGISPWVFHRLFIDNGYQIPGILSALLEEPIVFVEKGTSPKS